MALLLLGGGTYLLLTGNTGGGGDADRTTPSLTTSAGAALITLDPSDYIGKDGDAVETELDGKGLNAGQEPATRAMIDAAGQELAPGEVAALKAGTIDALLSQAASDIGADAVKTLVATLRNPKGSYAPMKDHDKYLPLRVLTKDNVDDPASAPYLYKSTCG